MEARGEVGRSGKNPRSFKKILTFVTLMIVFLGLAGAAGFWYWRTRVLFKAWIVTDDSDDGYNDKTQPKTFDDFTKLYAQQFGGRQVPVGLQYWFEYALANKCHTHPKYFLKMQQDLDVFRNLVADQNQKLSFKKMKSILEKTDYNRDYVRFLEFGYHTQVGDGRYRVLYGLANDIMKKIDRQFTVVYDGWDEPISLFDYESSKIANNTPDKYPSALEAAKNDICLAKHYGRYDDPKGKLQETPFFTAPCTFPAINYPIPALTHGKPEYCYADLIGATTYTGAFITEQFNTNKLGTWLDWSRKTDTLIFRGTNSGINHELNDIYGVDRAPRYRMHEWQRKSSVKDRLKLDLALSSHQNKAKDPAYQALMEKTYPVNPDAFMKTDDQFHAKYLLTIDGSGWPNRTAAFLHSNSVNIVMTAFRDWVTDQLLPMVHYVPAKTDFSDLDEKLAWLLDNPEEARLIGERGRNYAVKFLRVEDIIAYTAFQIVELAELMEQEDFSKK